jgi:protein-disulfide isomerase
LIITILGLIIVFGTMIGFYLYNEVKRINTEQLSTQQTSVDKNIAAAIAGPGTNYFLGPDKGAQVIIVEFADFACPFCEQSHTILRKIIARYPGKVKIIYRDMPLHENSVPLALGARCAGEQGKFWEMHDQLFANQKDLTNVDTLDKTIYDLAGTLGINAATFDSCYQSKKYLANISVDAADSMTLQLKGTPSWFIDDKLLTGYIPEADYFDLLDNYFAVKSK